MKAAPFTYLRPETLEEALAQVAGGEGFAKFVAGGQTLGPMMNLRLAQPDTLVDISRLAELREVREDGERVVFGGGVTHAMIEDGRVPDPSAGLLPHAAASLAYRAVRNRGTLGGSLAHADPSAEWPTVLSALDTEIGLRGTQGRRTVKLDALLIGPMTTCLGDDEVIETVSLRRLPQDARWGYHKICRKAGEFANAMAVVVLQGGAARAVLGALPRAPLVLDGTAELLGAARNWDAALKNEVDAALRRDLQAAELDLDPYDIAIHAAALSRAAPEAIEA